MRLVGSRNEAGEACAVGAKRRRCNLSGAGAAAAAIRGLLLAGIVSLCAIADGTAQTRLTSTGSGGERLPVLALDRSAVAYVALVQGSREVFTVDLQGGTAVAWTTGAEVRVGSGVFDAWPSLSISDDGQRIAYWSAAGVHVIDRAAASNVVVAPASVLAYPQIDGAGQRVVYQAPVQGAHEVFLVGAQGGTPVQLTQASGPGRRLPHLRGDRIVFQKPVGGHNEVFLIDVPTRQIRGPLTTGSGHGNRHARLSPDGSQVVWEAVVGGVKEVFVAKITPWNPVQVTSTGVRADRLPALTADDEVFLQHVAANLDIAKADTRNLAIETLTAEPRAGYRRPSVDRHGTVVVYQAEHQGASEVFALALCHPPSVTHFGQHGTPSTGTLSEWSRLARRDYAFGVSTALPPATAGALVLGTTSQATPLPSAPGNFLYVVPVFSVGTSVTASGNLEVTLESPVVLAAHTVFAQWALLDLPANALGVVTSKGVRVDFQ